MKKIISFLSLFLVFSVFISAQTNEFQKIIADDGIAYDYFGRSVATSGNYAIVGAHQNNSNSDGSGAAYIFELAGAEWIQTAKFEPTDGAADDEFGYSVDIDGNFAVVGSYMDDDRGDQSGSVYIFRNNSGTWEQVTKLVASDGEQNDNFGISVSISGNYIIVGAPGDDDNGTNSGAVYMYQYMGTYWNETKISITGNDQGDELGTSVAIEGNYAVIGAMGDDDIGPSNGAAYILKNNSGTWGQTNKIWSTDIAQTD
ncbi:MAG: FG-GAP repeat protein, partial [Bacteroidota bacterium]|nr:FG-GAP repeat protein [Bacteroidota bacterium]